MIPVLFRENSTSWTTNGLGRLSDAISCKVTEERNGKFELEMVYPTTGIHFADIGIRKIILAKPCQKDTLQPFRIYQITRPIHGKVTIYAQHLSYDLSKYVALPFSVTASGSACATVLSRLKSLSVSSCPFNFYTDVTTVSSYTQKVPSSIRQRLGGVEGSVLDQFGGEYEWDGYNVRLLRQRGSVTNYTLRYGKNLVDVEQEENIANTATGVVPYWMDVAGDTVKYGSVVYSSHRAEYSTDLIVPLDLSEEWDEEPTDDQLRTAATVYVNSAGFGIPKVSVKVDFINLADTEEYKDIVPMQSVNLCDTVKVQFEALGVDTTAKVVETVFDVLADRYESVQIGSLKSTLAGIITDYEASMAQTISETGERVFAQTGTEVKELVDNATAWLTSSGGYVIAVKNNDGSWKELLFMDTNDTATARNVLRINENGIGFSSTGVGGPYTQAWTLDGKLVIGGTNVPSITVYDNEGHILFQASAQGVQIYKGDITLRDGNNNIVFIASGDGVQVNRGSIELRNDDDEIVFRTSKAGTMWNSVNSSMTQNGTLTAKNATFTGGTLKLGGEDDGIMYVYDSNGRLRGKWDRTGMYIYRYDGNTQQTIFQANSEGARLNGRLHTENRDEDKYIDIYDEFIKFNDDAYFDFEGAGTSGGINCNADKFVLSVDDFAITRYRGSGTIRYGRNGDVITNLDTTWIYNICTNLRYEDGEFRWEGLDIEVVTGWDKHNTVNGLVVN